MATETISSSSPSEGQHRIGFMDLPVEIRLDIYGYLFHMPPYSKIHHPHDLENKVSLQPNLLLANRQINAEATPFLYDDNTFLAHPNLLTSFPRLRSWYGTPLKESAVHHRIRRYYVAVRLDCNLPYDKDTVTKAFSGLDELTIDVMQSMYLGVGHSNLAKFEGIRGVKRVRITGSTTGFEDYIRWLEGAICSEPSAEVTDFESHRQGWAEFLTTIHHF